MTKPNAQDVHKEIEQILKNFRDFARHNDKDMELDDSLTSRAWREYDEEHLTEATNQLTALVDSIIGEDETRRKGMGLGELHDLVTRNEFRAVQRARLKGSND